MPRDLAQLGRDYADFIIGVFERLCMDDGQTVAADDLAQLTRWHLDKVLGIDSQLRAEGLTESDIAAWRAECRDQITFRMNRAGEATI